MRYILLLTLFLFTFPPSLEGQISSREPPKQAPSIVLGGTRSIYEFVDIDQPSNTPIYRPYGGKEEAAFELKRRYEINNGQYPNAILLIEDEEGGVTSTLHHQGNGIFKNGSQK